VDRRLQDFAARDPENAAMNYYYAFSLWDRGGGEEGRHMQEIEALLRKAVAKEPGWYEPHYLLGILLESEKHNAEAIVELRKATKLEPNFSPAHYHLAGLCKHIGDLASANHEAAIVREIKDKDREADTAPVMAK
jgi:tetratricopeptide (TPR) repeat protein